jgi:hypothetical protein
MIAAVRDAGVANGLAESASAIMPVVFDGIFDGSCVRLIVPSDEGRGDSGDGGR